MKKIDQEQFYIYHHPDILIISINGKYFQDLEPLTFGYKWVEKLPHEMINYLFDTSNWTEVNTNHPGYDGLLLDLHESGLL